MSIVPINLRSVLRSLVNVSLTSWHPSRALYVGIDLRVFDEEYKPGASGSVHLLFLKPSNYVTVWTHTDNGILPQWTNVKDWGDHAVSHDSCWIDEAESDVTKKYFDLCDEAKAAGKVAEDTPPGDMGHFHCISSTALLDIEVSREKGERRTSRFVTSIKRITPPEHTYRTRP